MPNYIEKQYFIIQYLMLEKISLKMYGMDNKTYFEYFK